MVPVAAVLCLAASTVDSTVDDHYLQDSSNTGDDVHPHGHPRATKMYACLQNCAYCVQFWEHGLYNGRRCAKRCVHRQGRIVVDPDCNDPKMFNYSPRIISDLLMEMRENQADEPASVEEEDVDESDGVGGARNRAERSDRMDVLERMKMEADERRHRRSKSGRKLFGKKKSLEPLLAHERRLPDSSSSIDVQKPFFWK